MIGLDFLMLFWKTLMGPEFDRRGISWGGEGLMLGVREGAERTGEVQVLLCYEQS